MYKRQPEYRREPTPFHEPEIEYLGDVSHESNISVPRTPGTPKNNEKVGENLNAVTQKVFGPSESHKIRTQGKIESNEDKKGLKIFHIGNMEKLGTNSFRWT